MKKIEAYVEMVNNGKVIKAKNWEPHQHIKLNKNNCVVDEQGRDHLTNIFNEGDEWNFADEWTPVNTFEIAVGHMERGGVARFKGREYCIRPDAVGDITLQETIKLGMPPSLNSFLPNPYTSLKGKWEIKK